MVNVAVFASGNGSNFENLANYEFACAKVCLLIVDKQSYAIERAKKLSIDWVFCDPKQYASKEEYEKVILQILIQYQIDIIALAGYMRFIGSVLLHAYPKRIINLHPAYLPQFPGANSIQEAYDARVEYSGVTIHYVDEGIDTGQIIYQEIIYLNKDWTLEQFESEIHKREYRVYPLVLDSICKEVENEKKSIN